MTDKGMTGRRLKLEKYIAMVGILSEWRLDPGLQTLERERKKGRILGFVRGLRFASQLIYALRAALSQHDHIEVSWGHLLDDDETLCSPECDVIVHHKGGTAYRWNGDTGGSHVMDFRFVMKSSVVAVISCKSFIRQLDRDYPSQMAKYCSKTYLLGECCPAVSTGRLRSQATAAGYAGFSCLYTVEKTGVVTNNENEWLAFVEKLSRACGAKSAKTRRRRGGKSTRRH